MPLSSLQRTSAPPKRPYLYGIAPRVVERRPLPTEDRNMLNPKRPLVPLALAAAMVALASSVLAQQRAAPNTSSVRATKGPTVEGVTDALTGYPDGRAHFGLGFEYANGKDATGGCGPTSA